MFLSVIVIARDGEWTPSNGIVYVVFMCCVLAHGVLASTLSKVMGKLQTVFVAANFILIAATVVALPIGRASQRNDGKFIFATTGNLTTWPTGWAWFLSWLSPIWTIGAFDSCVHMSEEAANATRAVPYGILMSIGACWLFGWIIVIVIAACINPDVESVLGSSYGQPMAQIYYDAVGKKGALALMSLLFIVQFLMGLSILVAASRQSWGKPVSLSRYFRVLTSCTAFSRDGALPFSGFFRRISTRMGYIPFRTIWGCVLLALVLGLLCLIAPAAASALFSLAVAGNNVAWGVPIFCRLVWGGNKFRPGPFYTGALSKPLGWVAIVFLVFGIVLSMMPVGGPNPTAETMNYTIVINCAIWLGSLVYYFVDARKWFTGPKTTLSEEAMSEIQVEAEAIKEDGLGTD
jgi:amino acid transporter